MPSPHTITAPATPPGHAPRALIRLSGPEVPDLLASIVDNPPTKPGAHTATLRLPRSSPVADGGGVGAADGGGSPTEAPPPPSPDGRSPIVDPLSNPMAHCPLPIALLYNLAPHSYTTDDTAELLIPGNPHLVQRVLDLVLSFPTVRLAEPGEFTARAHLAGRLTLEEAEGVAFIIAAERDDELEAARDLLEGRTGDRYRAWTDAVAALLALVEAGIDFTDQEDVVPIPPADLAARLATLRAEITLYAGDPREQPTALPTVALVGPPSAGKSTLFNALLGRERAVTHESPGTTRDALSEPLDLSSEHPGTPTGTKVTLLDLPGLDLSPATPLDRAAQAAAIDAASHADLLLHCDPSGRFTQDPRLPPAKPTLRIRTKADLPGATPADALSICALDGFHLPALRRAIADHAHASHARGSVLPRHARALGAAADALMDARATIDPALHALPEPELTAEALRTALDHLGAITGAISPDAVLGRVFASFCVGK